MSENIEIGEALIPGLNVSRETMQTLRAYLALIEKWNASINLVSRATIADGWRRHICDSAQIFAMVDHDAKNWLDLGSGAGLPGLVVAILSKELRPDCRVTLIESDLRKATFLREASRVFALNTTVLAKRIDEVPPFGADVVSARALAPLQKLLPLAYPHLKPGGVALFLKGKSFQEEIETAGTDYRFKVEAIQSIVEESSAILRLREIGHVTK